MIHKLKVGTIFPPVPVSRLQQTGVRMSQMIVAIKQRHHMEQIAGVSHEQKTLMSLFYLVRK